MNRTSKKARAAAVASWIIASLPYAGALVLAVSSAYVRFSFGRWPKVYRDSVVTPFADAAILASAIAFLALIPLLLLAIGVGLARWLVGVRPIWGWWLPVFVAGWIAILAYVWWDPFGFVEWVLD